VGEINKIEQAKDDRQANGDEKVNHPQAQAIKHLKKIQVNHGKVSSVGAKLWGCGERVRERSPNPLPKD
jgi:hypothetical protein